jgi:hypothetical protein
MEHDPKELIDPCLTPVLVSDADSLAFQAHRHGIDPCLELLRKRGWTLITVVAPEVFLAEQGTHTLENVGRNVDRMFCVGDVREHQVADRSTSVGILPRSQRTKLVDYELGDRVEFH